MYTYSSLFSYVSRFLSYGNDVGKRNESQRIHSIYNLDRRARRFNSLISTVVLKQSVRLNSIYNSYQIATIS